MTRLSRKTAALVLGVLTVGIPAHVLKAQSLPEVTNALDQAEQVQRVRELQPQQQSQEDPVLYPGEEKDTGNQLLLETAPARWNWVNVSLDSQYFYTSNAYLTTTGKKGTGLLVSTAQGEIDAPPIMVPYGQLFLQAGYQYQFYNYGLGGPGHRSQLDFDAATAYLEAQYQLPDQWTVFGNVSYTRLLSNGSGFDEFYKELVPSMRFEKTFQIRKNLQASAEYSGNFRFSDEVPFPGQGRTANNRTDQALDFVLTWQFAPKFDLRPFYRFQYSYYPDYFAGQSRNDYLHTLGVSADYFINSWSSIRVFVSYEIRNSDAASAPDYRRLDAGGGISAAFQF